jgi:hypothetical protein
MFFLILLLLPVEAYGTIAMRDVFISYCRQNSTFTRRLIDKLILVGKHTWVDLEGIALICLTGGER